MKLLDFIFRVNFIVYYFYYRFSKKFFPYREGMTNKKLGFVKIYENKYDSHRKGTYILL